MLRFFGLGLRSVFSDLDYYNQGYNQKYVSGLFSVRFAGMSKNLLGKVCCFLRIGSVWIWISITALTIQRCTRGAPVSKQFETQFHIMIGKPIRR